MLFTTEVIHSDKQSVFGQYPVYICSNRRINRGKRD